MILADPRVRALYLIVLAIGVFFLPEWWMVGIACVVQVVLWFVVGESFGAMMRQLKKLTLFLGVILIAYSLVAQDPSTDEWHAYSVFGWTIEVNATGALFGLTMVLRVIAVVFASVVIRAGDPRALAAGLGKLGVPRSAAASIDAVLALLGDRQKGKRRRGGGGGGGGGGRGRGGGGGGGRGRGNGGGGGDDEPSGFWQGLKRLARGDIQPIVKRLFSHVDSAEQYVLQNNQDISSSKARDIAIIAGIALTMLGIKALKLLPGLPFAPGHKGVILIPLYVVAGHMTRSRAGSTITGLTMGTVAFLLGDGRYGVFEIVKHVAPGVIVDLLMPLMRAGKGRTSMFAWSAFGLIIALGRFATITAIALTVQAPALVYALLLPGLTIHAIFGVLSGVVTAPLIRALRDREQPP